MRISDWSACVCSTDLLHHCFAKIALQRRRDRHGLAPPIGSTPHRESRAAARANQSPEPPPEPLVAAAVRPGDDFEQMALGIVEVEAAAAEIAVDLLRLLLAGIGPVVQAARSDAGTDRIELLVADQKGVVLQRDLPIALVEVERGAIVELDHQEGPEADIGRANV